MPKPTLPKLIIAVAVILTVAGVGYASFMVWRQTIAPDRENERIIYTGVQREIEGTSALPTTSGSIETEPNDDDQQPDEILEDSHQFTNLEEAVDSLNNCRLYGKDLITYSNFVID
jgi:hypothetical protein